MNNLIVLSNIGLLPEIFLSISIIYLLIFGSILSTYKTYPLIQNLILNLSILILIYCLILVLNDKLWVKEVLLFNNSIAHDYLSFVSKICILVFSIICLIMIQNYIKDQKINQFEYIIIILLSILGFLILCSANDFITAYLAIELQSLAFYVMASFKRNSSFSVEAGLKYFILGSFSSAILLFGISLLYCATGSLNFEDYKDLYCNSFSNNLVNNSYNDKLNFSSFVESYHEYILLSELVKTLDFELYCFLGDIYYSSDVGILYKSNNMPELNSIFNSVNVKECYNKYILFNSDTDKLLNYDLFKFINYSMVNINEEISLGGSVNCDTNLNFIDYQDSQMFQSTINNEFVLFGLMLVFVSIIFKLAIAPLHAWSPDVYEGSPTSSTLFFAVVSKLSLLVLLLRIFYHSFHGLVYSWNFYIILIAVFSVMVGSFTALEQRKLKSLFAYSSTSHLGYILIAFCSGTIEGVQSIIAYIIIYMLSSSCIWSILILLKPKDNYNNKANKDLADVSSLIKSNSILGLILSTTLFSIAGFPPLIGFFTKLNIFLSAMESYMYLVAIVSILSSIISTFYYIRIIKIICFENKIVGRLYHPLPYLETLIVVVNFLLIIFLFINPTLLFLISHKISLLYFY